MPLQIKSILQVLAVLTLVVTIVWFAVNPSFEALVALLGAIAGTLTAIFVDKTKSSNDPQDIHKTLDHPQTRNYIPGKPADAPKNSLPIIEQNAQIDLWNTFSAGGAIIGCIIGFVRGLPEGAISAVLNAGVGVVAGVFVMWVIMAIIGYIIIALEMLWETRVLWLIAGALLALGYIITGRL